MRRVVPLITLLLAGCGAAPQAPLPPPPDSVSAKGAPPWDLFSDLERIRKLRVTPTRVWGIAREGLVVWDRATRKFHAETGADAPGGDVTDVAEAPDGTLYAGLPAGLARRAPGQRWERLSEAPLTSGVTALAPRAAGGVWVGLPRGLVRVDGAKIEVVSDRLAVRDLATGPDGRVWAATDGTGLVEIRDDGLVEHTSGQGLCGNRIRAVAFGGEGRVAVTCAEPGASGLVSMQEEGRWYTYAVEGLPAAIDVAAPVDGRLVLGVGGGWWALEPAPPPDPSARSMMAASQVRALAAPVAPEPPPPAPPSAPVADAKAPAADAKAPPVDAKAPAVDVKAPAADAKAPSAPPAGDLTAELRRATERSAPAPSSAAALPPPVPMPPPVNAPGASRLATTALPVRRADAAERGDPAKAPVFVLRNYPAGIPAGSEVTASKVSADGTAWYALAHRGVLAIRGASRERFVSLSLGAEDEAARLVSDHRGGVLLTTGGPRLLRWTAPGWTAWPVAAEPTTQVLTAAVDPFDQVWAVAWTGGKTLRVLKAAPGGPFAVLGDVALPWEGTPRAGEMVIDEGGTLVFPLFRIDEKGARHGAGLARIAPAVDRLEVWTEDAADDEGGGKLPSDWINTVVRAPAGNVTYLGTNSGLVRVAGSQTRTFDENDFLDSDFVQGVAIDREGKVWAATLEGLGNIAADRWTSAGRPKAEDRINAVALDAQGKVWVGTDQGLWRYDDGRWEEVRSGGERVPGAVRQIVFDGQGGRWVLTAQGVLHLTSDR
jgi:hypothetical protein